MYAEDAELTITQPRLRTNGVEQPAASLPAKVSAPVVWVDIPGQGRYDLSFKPRADQGFERAGEVAENSLVFSMGGNIFRIDCADRIATGSGTYNIYARKEPERLGGSRALDDSVLQIALALDSGSVQSGMHVPVMKIRWLCF